MDKESLFNNGTFCMFPWIHLNVTPAGKAYPCCTSDYADPVGNTQESSIVSIMNNDRMKQLRLNMLNGKQSRDCKFCYEQEKYSPHSFRTYANANFGKYFDEVVPGNTQEDGKIKSFQMKYIDIRFSNICNFKCRTCGSLFSSQWAAEDKKFGNRSYITLQACPDNRLLDEVISHLDHADTIYFGGGEPLLMEEHYTILEELIKRNRTDIKLRYNTNCSTIKYKTTDVFALWDHFKSIEISASLDHYGDKAEYIRNGTDWGVVESNLLKIRNKEHILFTMNTVLSIFNYLTLDDFYTYLYNKNILRKTDQANTLYNLQHESHHCARALPINLKKLGEERNRNLIKFFSSEGLDYTSLRIIDEAIAFTNAEDWFEKEKENFKLHVGNRDKIRNEDVLKTFPELQGMFN